MTIAAPQEKECRYQYTNGAYCGQEEAGATGYCILHTQNHQKDQDEFQWAADEKIAKGDYNFQGCVVPYGVTLDFSRSRWHGDARVDFRGAEFSEAQFHNGARADFSEAQFHDRASADFIRAQFHDGARADFSEAEFHDGAGAAFVGAQFHDRAGAYFNEAQFHDGARADFFLAQFHDRARAYFFLAQFHGEAGAAFRGAQFHDGAGADFSGARLQHLDFPGEFFKGVAHFTRASFRQRTVFVSCQFAPGSTFEGVDLENVAFRGCHLGGVSFRDAVHLAEAEFEDIRWGKLADVVDRSVVWDEGKARESNKSEDYAAAERVYRGLKQSYERRGDYPRGGEFYYGEMEMRRLVLPGAQRDFFSVLGLYWQLSGYGLQWRKAAIWFFLIVVPYFALFYMLAGFPALQSGQESMGNAEVLAHALSLSLGAMLLQVPDTFATSSIGGQILLMAQRVLGPLLLGLMALAIRRKVHR